MWVPTRSCLQVRGVELSRTAEIADRFEHVTMVFVDMVGFTAFSSQLDPDELMLFLNNLYARFEVVLKRHCLWTIEIIGDALFAIAGCPQESVDEVG